MPYPFSKNNTIRYHHVTVLLFTWFCYTNENPGIVSDLTGLD